jgi:hypothetical protein
MPLLEGVLSEALGSLLAKVVSNVAGKAAAAPVIHVDLGITKVKDAQGEELLFTDAQLAAIATFLRTPEAMALAQTYTLGTAVAGRYAPAREWVEESTASFVALFERHVQELPKPATDTAYAVWGIVTENLGSIAPLAEAMTRVPADDIDRLFISKDDLPDIQPPPRYIREVLAVTSDSLSLERLLGIFQDIRRAVLHVTAEVKLEHTQEHHRFSRDKLYIDRTLHPALASTVSTDGMSSEALLSRYGGRTVIVGHPGAGKSTFVTHMAYTAAMQSKAVLAPIVIKCRDFGSEPDLPPIDQIVRSLSVEYSVSTAKEDVEYLLALGRCLVIFDGVDEYVDVQHRRQQIAAIELLAMNFPLASIVCTTRKMGYESAKFRDDLFELLELHEYTDEQVVDYATRWFALMGRPDRDRQAFLIESNDIVEIRCNPLMLSLLCTLYRVRGYIPMNRRDVYKECADLLFYGWDALRHIPQPVDNRRYGHNLMEDLAHFFFTFPSAAAGVEERQLVRLVAQYFRDTAGVEEHESLERASNFLEFCATRAWLLTAAGFNSRGQRLFAFTHRTFMEFYTAEALIRRSDSYESARDAIVRAFRSNPSSVLPELMAQAYENRSHRGAESLLRDMIRNHPGSLFDGVSLEPLCLRILNSTPVSAPLTRDVLIAALRSWATANTDLDRASFISMLQLSRDNRRICIQILDGMANEVSGKELSSFRKRFLIRWASLWFVGQADPFLADWQEVVDSMVSREGRAASVKSRAVAEYLVHLGQIPVTDLGNDLADAVALRCFGAVVPGILTRALWRLSLHQSDETDESVLHYYGNMLRRSVSRVTNTDSEAVDTAIREASSRMPAFDQSVSRQAKYILIWLTCVLAEKGPGEFHPFYSAANGAFPERFLLKLLRARLAATRGAPSMSQDLLDVGQVDAASRAEIVRLSPDWITSWISGERTLIGYG